MHIFTHCVRAWLESAPDNIWIGHRGYCLVPDGCAIGELRLSQPAWGQANDVLAVNRAYDIVERMRMLVSAAVLALLVSSGRSLISQQFLAAPEAALQ